MSVWLTDSSNAPLAVTWQSVNLNTVSKTEGSTAPTLSGYQLLSTGTQMAEDYITEVKQWSDGIELYGMRNVQRVLNMRGYVYGLSLGDLGDKCAALSKITNPSRIWFRNPTAPFLPLTFSTPSTDTTIPGYSTGLVPSQYLVTPLRMFEPPQGLYSSLAIPFLLSFMMREPVRYGTSLVTQAWTHTGGSHTMVGSGDTTTSPTITIVTSAAASSSYTIQNTGTIQGARTIVLDLSVHAAGTYVMDMLGGTITFGGTLVSDVVTSSTASPLWKIEPGNNVIVCDSSANVTSTTITFYDAWSD